MRRSCIRCLGDVPEHWERFRLKYLATLTMGQSPPSGAVQADPVGFFFLQGCAEFGFDHPSANRYCCSPPKVAQKRTILLSVRAPVGKINLADKEYGIGRGLCAVQPNPRWHDRFAWWQLHVLHDDLKKVATGSTYGAVSVDDVADLNLMIPPYTEQRAIATFLDWATAKIDALIDKTQTLIERLQERRRALITETIARGLPPDENRKASFDSCPKLKPSGVEWLGDVPEHWEIRRMRHVVTLTTGPGTPKLRQVQGGEHRHIGMDAVKSWTGELVDALLTTKVASPSSRAFSRGDVMFGKLRPYLAKTCRPDFDGLCSGEFLVLDGDDDIDNRYLLYLLLSQYMVALADSSTYGTKMPRTNWQEVGSSLVPVPPIQEQVALCAFLDNATAEIDSVVRRSGRLIDRLREKRQALITAAVTGQIDVRGAPEGETA